MARILGIETSCDETAAAVVEDRTRVLSSVIASQIELHREYGGVVPELAARRHVEAIGFVISSALEQAEVGWDDLDAVAVTHGPGLIGCLLVGVSTAKAICGPEGQRTEPQGTLFVYAVRPVTSTCSKRYGPETLPLPW